MNIEADVGVMSPLAKECRQPPGAGSSMEKSLLWREHCPTDSLILV